MISESVQVAGIVAIAPIVATVVSHFLTRKKLVQQDVVLKEQSAVAEQIHTAVNSNYSELGQRLDKALLIVDELKEEIIRMNREGIITSPGKRRGDVTMKDGVVETRSERDKEQP